MAAYGHWCAAWSSSVWETQQHCEAERTSPSHVLRVRKGFMGQTALLATHARNCCCRKPNPCLTPKGQPLGVPQQHLAPPLQIPATSLCPAWNSGTQSRQGSGPHGPPRLIFLTFLTHGKAISHPEVSGPRMIFLRNLWSFQDLHRSLTSHQCHLWAMFLPLRKTNGGGFHLEHSKLLYIHWKPFGQWLSQQM